MKRMWFHGVVILMLVLAMCSTGCNRRKGKKTGPGADEIGGKMGGDITSVDQGGLSSRPAGAMNIIEGLNLASIIFDYDSAQVKTSERAKIEAVADYMKKNTQVGCIVEGHCDERGSVEYNLALGERRALAVRAYIIGLGIDGNAIQTKSLGKEHPLDPGHDEAAWAKNRRAEFVMFNP